MGIANLHLLKNQTEIMKQLDHPNIVKFIDVHYSDKHCYIVMEYCEGGNLEKYISRKDEGLKEGASKENTKKMQASKESASKEGYNKENANKE